MHRHHCPIRIITYIFISILILTTVVSLPIIPGCSGSTQDSIVTTTATQVSTATTTALSTVTVTSLAKTSYPLPTGLASNVCYGCHVLQTPGITTQFVQSVMAQNGVTCSDCHQTAADYPGTQAHYAGTYRLIMPTPAKCQSCHPDIVDQYEHSRHSVPAYVAVNGTAGLSDQVLAIYQSIPEGSYTPDKSEHPLAALEGDTIIPYACNSCHTVGEPHPDNSVGDCQKCHLTHTFSLEQSRKPETCNACHIGPDHPQFEIYQESAHGIRYATDGQNWNWTAVSGTLTVQDMPAPTCATCHFSSFGSVVGTHDVGDRLTTFLFAEISSTRPDAQANKSRMQAICQQCHAVDFVAQLYDGAGELTNTVNDLMKQADTIMADLQSRGLLSAAPFDEEIDFVYFDTWHDFGRTTKFGAWMNGPDYSQWHGAYEILRHLNDLERLAGEKISEAG